MDNILMVVYIIAAVAGSTLIKLGGTAEKALFTIPVANMGISLMSLFGIFAYGISFFTYIFLLTRFDLSYVSPLLVGIVYVLLMLTAFIIFKESFTTYKVIGCCLILIGVILVLLKK